MRIYSLHFNVLRICLNTDGLMYVKQKTGCLPYNEDPKGFKSLHAQCLMKDSVRGWSYKVLVLYNKFETLNLIIIYL